MSVNSQHEGYDAGIYSAHGVCQLFLCASGVSYPHLITFVTDSKQWISMRVDIINIFPWQKSTYLNARVMLKFILFLLQVKLFVHKSPSFSHMTLFEVIQPIFYSPCSRHFFRVAVCQTNTILPAASVCSCLVCRCGGEAGESPVVIWPLQQADQTSGQQQPAGYHLHPSVTRSTHQRGEKTQIPYALFRNTDHGFIYVVWIPKKQLGFHLLKLFVSVFRMRGSRSWPPTVGSHRWVSLLAAQKSLITTQHNHITYHESTPSRVN